VGVRLPGNEPLLEQFPENLVGASTTQPSNGGNETSGDDLVVPGTIFDLQRRKERKKMKNPKEKKKKRRGLLPQSRHEIPQQ